MTHHRVSPTGQQMGNNAARLAELGRRRLEAAGLTGLGLAAMRDEMCSSCACRPGTVPNGCLQTQLDLLKAAVEGERFLCHAPKDGRMCAGWLRVRAQIVAEPLPPEAQALVARWQYSPPDEHGSNAELRSLPPAAVARYALSRALPYVLAQQASRLYQGTADWDGMVAALSPAERP